MFTSSEFDRINQEFMKKQKERKSKLLKVWGTLLALTVGLIIFFIILFPKQFESGGTAWILPTYGGMILLTVLIGFSVSMSFTSEKPFFEFLFHEVIQKINMYEGTFLEYHAYEKKAGGFNKEGGLFTGFANVKLRRRLSGQTEDHHKFDIVDCIMTTSNGKSQQTHFDGTYFILDKRVSSSLQVRTKGSPKLKKVKFDRLDQIESIRVYKEREQQVSNLDHLYIEYIKRLSERLEYKNVYFSIVDGQLHLAIWFKKHPIRKSKPLTLEKLNSYANEFMNEYRLINELAKIDNF